MTAAITIIDRMPVATTPLYSARMMLLSGPSRTKNVPITEVTMQTPPITSGRTNSRSSSGGAKKIAASSIVATIVTT